MEGKHISIAAKEAKKIIEDRRDGIIRSLLTPWHKLNISTMGGLEWGTMAAIGGMSGSGKTAFAAQLYREIHDLNPTEDFVILFFTFEMTAAKIIHRDIIANTHIRRENLLSGNGNTLTATQNSSVDAYLSTLVKKEIFFIETAKTPEDYIKICREYHVAFKKRVLAFSDHSLLFEGENRDDDRGMLVKLSKAIMKVKNEGWNSHILLSQLNRDIESVPRRTPNSPLNYPQKGDLFASDSIFQASDYVFMIHRPYSLKFMGNTYGPDKFSTLEDDVYIHIIKQREEKQAILTMKANFAEMKILDA